MMISLIVVALVGIGFTRLTMLALELRDNFDEMNGEETIDMGRKRVDCHNRMRTMAKPEVLVFKNDNQFETASSPGDDHLASAVGSLSQGFSSLFLSTTPPPLAPDTDLEKGGLCAEPPKKNVDDEKASLYAPSNSDDESLLDPTDACTICFEKAKNAVILSCGHGGCCYNCSIDVCVTSGMCPFCRQEISQIVTIGLGRYEKDASGRRVVPVIGPK